MTGKEKNRGIATAIEVLGLHIMESDAARDDARFWKRHYQEECEKHEQTIKELREIIAKLENRTGETGGEA